ncbi:O-phosphoseryl-tRNA(Sec) selenium transferase [Plasmodium gonderi]|uniref:O-phosphoseryl-tRNA(Sec) selenium transferase n=1 Tax=Plasmodium gonderi TaxID=77519 RepID=A0A1Y1JS07_PLAGO|nr:O-phosphoseryl-tRNA(Sec) selenium transferase [Plasmodium gonderi]GAW82784.1 O-phosphoseryl-tRNA(Sec) selenium transferase [Plasmodium gonderi]
MNKAKEDVHHDKSVQGDICNNKYSLISKQTLSQKQNTLWNILNYRRVPNEGLNEITIMHILHHISSQNLCNSEKNVKIGERENRIYSAFVRSKYIGFGHGIGRSGNLDDVQPKSAGNSILAKVTTGFVKDLIKSFGIRGCEDVYILPYATGMCISTCLLYIRKLRKSSEYVIVSRIDHKTCYKCIDFCNLKYLVVDMIYRDEELFTDLDTIEKLIKIYNEKICCVMSVTSSYAPRNSDEIVKISHICKRNDIPHIINNAFGLQCNYLCNQIQKCFESKGRVDFVIQSCDKNFLVPVTGGIVFNFDKKQMKELKKHYPGRTPVHAYLDLFITLLELGKKKILNLRKEREENFIWLQKQISTLCSKYNLSLIKNSKNKISMAINLNNLYNLCNITDPKIITLLGSLLFYRNVTGHKVICSPLLIRNGNMNHGKKQMQTNIEPTLDTHYEKVNPNTRYNITEQGIQTDGIIFSNKTNGKKDNAYFINPCENNNDKNEEAKVIPIDTLSNNNFMNTVIQGNALTIGNHTFKYFGCSYDFYPFSYIAFSCVIGIEREEMQSFVEKLDDSISYFIRRFQKKDRCGNDCAKGCDGVNDHRSETQ